MNWVILSPCRSKQALRFGKEQVAEAQEKLAEQTRALIERGDLSALKQLLEDKRSSVIAEIVEFVDNEERRTIFNVLDRERSAEVLEKIDEATRSAVFELLEDHELKAMILELGPDDAADLLAEMPEDESEELLGSISPSKAARIRQLMSYSKDSAGGIMDPVVISVQEDATVGEAVNQIRAAEIDEDFYSVFVVDKSGKFLGEVRIRYLLTSPEEMRIAELLDPDAIYVTADADQEEVRNIFSKNDLIVVPVLDKNHKLVGRITADRIIEVAEEEAAEDLYTMAGTDADELDKFSAFHAARVRITWLFPCLIGTSVTALVMTFFSSLDPVMYVAAAAFVPMIAAISGNAGLQTSTIVVSGLATGHLAALKFGQVFGREVRIAILVALFCGVIGGLLCACLLSYRAASDHISAIRIVAAFSVGMFTAIMVATTLGLILPFLFRGIGIDPAISSGPLVTTANDSMSVAIYMTLTLMLTQ